MGEGNEYPPWKWRVGAKLGRTLYFGDILHGLLDSPEIARRVADAMNAASTPKVEHSLLEMAPHTSEARPCPGCGNETNLGTCLECAAKRSGEARPRPSSDELRRLDDALTEMGVYLRRETLTAIAERFPGLRSEAARPEELSSVLARAVECMRNGRTTGGSYRIDDQEMLTYKIEPGVWLATAEDQPPTLGDHVRCTHDVLVEYRGRCGIVQAVRDRESYVALDGCFDTVWFFNHHLRVMTPRRERGPSTATATHAELDEIASRTPTVDSIPGPLNASAPCICVSDRGNPECERCGAEVRRREAARNAGLDETPPIIHTVAGIPCVTIPSAYYVELVRVARRSTDSSSVTPTPEGDAP